MDNDQLRNVPAVDIDLLVKLDQDAVADMTAARNTLRRMNDIIHSRELSLAITQIETAMLWQAAGRSGLDAMMMLTASHIPDVAGE